MNQHELLQGDCVTTYIDCLEKEDRSTEGNSDTWDRNEFSPNGDHPGGDQHLGEPIFRARGGDKLKIDTIRWIEFLEVWGR
jgi:hypothetical protein